MIMVAYCLPFNGHINCFITDRALTALLAQLLPQVRELVATGFLSVAAAEHGG